MSEHTPGPWLVEDPMGSGPGDSLWIVQDTTGQVYDWRNLAVVCSDDPTDAECSRPISVVERDANARLIAAAPTLLDALAWFIDDIDGSHTVMADFDANVERARAAIAAAKGEA